MEWNNFVLFEEAILSCFQRCGASFIPEKKIYIS
jgi:hypothetical protein